MGINLGGNQNAGGGLLGGLGKMGCGLVGCGGLLLIVLIIGGWMMSGYNGMVAKRNDVEKSWSDVESQYQRRADFMKQAVAICKGVKDAEIQAQTQVIEQRAAATQTKIDASQLTEEQLAEFQRNQDELSSAFNKLMVSVEAYPNFEFTENFRNLQSQVEGTENRINKARTDFNKVATEYNTLIEKFPNNILAGFFNFQRKPTFKAQAGADVAPDISFD